MDRHDALNLLLRKERRRRIGLVTVSCLYTFTFVGAFFGWGPMQLMVRLLADKTGRKQNVRRWRTKIRLSHSFTCTLLFLSFFSV
jgi:hypothetical protein